MELGLRQFVAQAFFVRRLEQARPEFTMYANGKAYHPLSHRIIIERHFSQSRYLIVSPSRCDTLKEEGEVFAEQHVLVEQDLAVRDLPARPGAAQQVLAFADEDVGLGLDAIPVDE